MTPATPKILMVDDEPRNLRILEGLLAPLQYDLRRAENGREALDRIAADPPDIVLLDVMMPGLSGFDVCRQIKGRPETRHIPVVLVTALTERDAKLTGLAAGADDFLNKPVDPHELRARVQSLLQSKARHDQLQESYAVLQHLERMRETLTQMIVHDLRNPLSALIGYLRLLHRRGHISPEETAQHNFRGATMCGQTLMDMIVALLDLAKLEAGEMQLTRESVDLSELLHDVHTGMQALLEQKHLTLQIRLPEALPALNADREILRRILVNIIGNAISFSPSAGQITITAQPEMDATRVAVQDQGPGIPPEARTRIFEKFGQVESRQSGRKYTTGLGLAFCKMATEAHGGRIGCDGEEGRGSTFWFTLPETRPSRD